MTLTNSPTHRRWVVETFVTGNLGFLAIDVWLAHSVNAFRHWAEWIPFGFSIVAPLLLIPGLAMTPLGDGIARKTGGVVGGSSILVGVAGLLWHLDGTFFVEQTLHNLVYTAPFAAPLSYSGLGFLLILNRTESPDSSAYGQWVTLLAAGGFAGNLTLTLADHAQNGFFYVSEWIGVGAAAAGLAFLLTATWAYRDRRYLEQCGWVMVAQVLVGLTGTGLHFQAILEGPSTSWLDNAIHTAPLFAPLLFVDLAILGAIGLWCSHSTAT